MSASAAPDPAWLRAQAAELDSHATTVRLAAATAVAAAYHIRRATPCQPGEPPAPEV
ncbi:MAG TPA: hypothetical protein VHX59_06465 [Mycobacteriales bacterium]|nr:hypothetical protein [Mycobacteriales bacterium]